MVSNGHTAVRIALLLALAIAPAPLGAAEEADSASDSFQIPRLITQLSDGDPAVRERATERLIAIGGSARAQVLRAARSGDPEQRARAAEILKKLPWHLEADPPQVRTLMRRYGDASDAARTRIIADLDEVEGGGAALLRLLHEEPAHRLRWAIVAFLWDARDADTHKRLRLLDISDDDPPVLLLAGRAWIERDPPRARQLLRRAIDADEARPSGDSGILTFAFDQLIERALQANDFEQAAGLLRRQVPRDASARRQIAVAGRSREFAESVSFARLVALHTYFGPLRGYREDLLTWGNGRRVKLDAVSAAYALLARFGAAPPMPRPMIELSPQEHYSAGAFLARHRLFDAAEIELKRALMAKSAVPDRQERDVLHANTLFMLAQVAAQRGDDAAAADALASAMQIKSDRRFGLSGRGDDDVLAELHFRRARVAHARGDKSAANGPVKDLLQYTPSNTDMTLEIIDWLKQTSREPAAKRLFEKVYVQSRARLDAAETRDIPGMQNDLAWLCARAGERLDEAHELARAAVDASPENGAFLDTLAEVQFRRGHAAEAAALEEKALSLSPESEFMREQLQRFRAGVKATSQPAKSSPSFRDD